MVYPFLTLDDAAEIVHSEMRTDAIVRCCLWYCPLLLLIF